MAAFTDNAGRPWRVSLTVSDIKRVRDLLDFDLLNEDVGAMVIDLAGDVVMVADVLFVICKPQADQQEVSDVSFGEGLAGDALQAATDALIIALIEFLPKKKRREVLQTTWDKINAAQDRAETAALELVTSEEMEAAITANLEAATAEAMKNLTTGK